MTKLKQLIGEGRAIFASALCLPAKALAAAGLLSCILLAPSARAATMTNVKYIDAEGKEQTCPSATVVTANNEAVTWTAGWYVITDEISIQGGAIVNGDVKLILADGCRATLTGYNGSEMPGIQVSNSNPSSPVNLLTIYGQSGGTGTLIANGGTRSAGIGGGSNEGGDNITINGGTVIATGNDNAAGIGGGFAGDGHHITINGGYIRAVGKNGGAAIGGGEENNGGGAGYAITVNGGTIDADEAWHAYNIGHGDNGDESIESGVAITGGSVWANGRKQWESCGLKNPTNAVGELVYEVTVTNVQSVGRVSITGLDGYGVNDLFAIDNKLKFYLPNGTYRFWSGDMRYDVTVNNAAVTAQATETVSVTYIDAAGNEQTTNAIPVAASDSRVTWTADWYVVTNEVALSKGADCSGEVHLILADTGALTINNVASGNAGIGVSGDGNSLAVYGQTLGTGALNVDISENNYGAGIGGGDKKDGGNITINGGIVTAIGGFDGAGIGGGYSGAGSNITINGGTVTADGGVSGGQAAGIGGGDYGVGSNIRINGGTVTANGGLNAAGIGNGGGCSTAASEIYAADDVIVKAGKKENPTDAIAHLSTQDIASDLAGKRYVTTVLPMPAEVTVTDVTGATAKVYTNKIEITERPAIIKGGMAFDVVYTADEGYMFKGGYKTFTTNLTADAATMTVALTAGQQPVEAQACEACLTFSGDAAFGIKMKKVGPVPEPKLEYSTDKTYWSKYNLEHGADAGADNKLYLRGTGNTQFAKGDNKYYTFTNTADSAATAIACSGNIMTLLDYQKVEKGEEPAMGEFAFAYLFQGFAALTDVPTLPSTNLVDQCYALMFKDCTSLEVNTDGTGKAWSIPSDAATSAETVSEWNREMFSGTSGSITNAPTSGKPDVGVTYYVRSAILPVTVTVPEVEGASAELFVFNVNGGWKSVETNAVPSNAMVRVVWTAEDGRALAAEGAVNVFQWQATLGPVVGGESAPAPTVSEAGDSEVTIAVDTRSCIVVGSQEDVLPIWYEAGGEVQVKREGEQWSSLVKNAAKTDTLCWTPTDLGVYTLTQTGFESSLIIYSQPFSLSITQPAEGGSVVAITNGIEATGTFEVLGFENVTIAAKPAEHWQLKEMAVATNGVAVLLEEPAGALTNRFEMPCCDTVVTGAFVIAESYRAELAEAATNSYLATSNGIERLRQHRLTDAETEAALAAALVKLDSAASAIAAATTPGGAETAKSGLDSDLDAVEAEAKRISDSKPTAFLIAEDFTAIPGCVYDPATGEIAIDGFVFTNGVSAFGSFTAAFTNEAGPYVRQLFVVGRQTIAMEPTMTDEWQLALCSFEDGEGNLLPAVVSVDPTKTEPPELVNITNRLMKVRGIFGTGTIILGKTDVPTTVYDEFIRTYSADNVVVKNAGAEPVKDGENLVVTVTGDSKTEAVESTSVVILPGVENLAGGIGVKVRNTATNDVLAVGTLKAPSGDVFIRNESLQELVLLGSVCGKNVYVKNLGKSDDAEGSILAAEIAATADVEINNNAHLEANVVAGGKISIYNDSPNTIVGTYDGSTISITGGKAGAISNVTFISDGPVVMKDVNILTGPLAIEAPAGAITNEDTLVWNVGGDNTTAHLADFGAITQGEDAAFGILVDGEQETNGVNNTYFLAENAAGAWGATFALSGTTFKTNIVVGGEQLYIGQKEYTLTNQADRLVFKVDWGVSDAMRAAYLASVSNDAAQAIADLAAVKTLTPSELEALSEQVEEAMQKAVDDLTTVRKPMDAESILEDFAAAVDDLQTAGDKAAEGMVRFAEHQVEAEGGTEFDLVVYGGSTNRTTAATVNFVKGTWTSKPKATVNGKRVRFPIALNWAKGDREPKVVTLKIPANRKVDRFFALQLGSEVASTVGTPDIVTVTVRGSKGADDAAYVRAFAWPANGGKVAGSRKLATRNVKATLQAKPNKWATFAGWYRAKADDPEQIDLENGFVSSDRKIKVSQAEAGTYFAYFTDVLPVIAVDDPNLSGASGIATNEDGVATCIVGLNVELPLTFTTAEGDDTGRLSVSKLPRGLKYNRKTGLVTGVPSRAGVYNVQLKGKNRSGKHYLTYTIVVQAMDDALVGTFTGNLLDAGNNVVGSATVRVTSTGGITVIVKSGRIYRFSTKGFVDSDACDATLERSNIGTVFLKIGRDPVGNPDGSYAGVVEGEKFDGQLQFTVR